MFNWSTQTGVSISDEGLTLVELKNGELVHQAVQPFLKSWEETVMALRAQSVGKSKSCIVSVPPSWCHFARVQFPQGMDEKIMNAAMPEQLEKALPISLDTLLYDHQIDVKKGVVFFAGVEKNKIETIDAAFQAADWKKTQYVHDGIALHQLHGYQVFQGCGLYVFPLNGKVFINLSEDSQVLDSLEIKNLPEGLKHMINEADTYFHEKVDHAVIPENLCDGLDLNDMVLHKLPSVENGVVEQVGFAKGAALSSELFASDDRFNFLNLLK